MRLSDDASDAIRFLSLVCAVLVCFNHAYTIEVPYLALADQAHAAWSVVIQNIWKFSVARISTPFFFTVAAFMLFSALVRREEDGPRPVALAVGYRGEIAKRLRTLALPFALWSAWSFALLAALQQLPPLTPFFQRDLLALPPARLANVLLWDPVAHQLWFVRDLLLLAVAWPLVWLLVRQRTVGLAVVAALCVPWFLWHEIRETRAVVFFTLGAWLAVHRPVVRPPRWVGTALLATGLALATLHAAWVMAWDATHPVLNNLAIATLLPGAWFVTLAALPALRRPWLPMLAGQSFIIYCAHEPVATLARKALVHLAGDTPMALFAAWLAAGTLTFLGCLATALLLRRWWPGLHGMLSGGRGRRRAAPLPVPEAGGVAARSGRSQVREAL